jgi:death-on-curing protein
VSQPEPRHTIDVPFLLAAAELLPGDPQVDDLGPLYAAVARVNARPMGVRDVYGSVFLKAAALLETLTRLPCLEHSNDAFAWHSCEAYLDFNGYTLEYEPKDAVALVRDSAARQLGVFQIARQLRAWSVSGQG